jgi:outer membrane PBP1 activator LpoA protein
VEPSGTDSAPSLEQSTTPDATVEINLEAPQPNSKPMAKSLYSFTPLDRLYALGLESYHLIPRLSALRKDSWQQYNGQAFRASIEPNGNVLRHLEWATFKQGYVTPLRQLSIETDTPVEQVPIQQ